jgi:hypothetical protein
VRSSSHLEHRLRPWRNPSFRRRVRERNILHLSNVRRHAAPPRLSHMNLSFMPGFHLAYLLSSSWCVHAASGDLLPVDINRIRRRLFRPTHSCSPSQLLSKLAGSSPSHITSACTNTAFENPPIKSQSQTHMHDCQPNHRHHIADRVI